MKPEGRGMEQVEVGAANFFEKKGAKLRVLRKKP
jgi:hypothetical protein